MSDTFDHWEEAYYNNLDDISDTGIWTMKTGVLIAYVDMETSHLKNTIALLERKSFDVPYAMQQEFNKRIY